MGMTDSTNSFRKKLRLDSHHAIERFGIAFGALSLTAVIVFGSAGASSVANQQASLDSTTLYTPDFTTSRTQLGGEVSGVYVNSDRTRAMVLMKFKDSSSISADADTYRAFLTGSNKELVEQPLKSEMTGQIAVFGSTGYMAMVIDSDEPFQQQILNLTMRAGSELIYEADDKRKVRQDLEGQTTFTENDQWRLYFNPGASGAETATSLDAEEFDASAVYSQLIIEPTEDEVRATLETELAQMQVDQARIKEYESEAARMSVDEVYIVLPEVPEQIAGDEITGSPATDDEDSTLELDTEWVSPSGYDFDWRDGSVEDGYLDGLVDDGESYVTYLATKREGSRAEGTTARFNNLEWALTNGRLLSDYGNSDRAMQPLFEIRKDLSSAYQDYYRHKLDHQTKTYAQLIDLEVDLRNVRSAATVTTDPEALFTY